MKGIRWAAIVLLAFLALSAIAGGVPMIANPYGNPVGMPQSLLRTTPFHSYLAPGILLLAFNGLLALWCFWEVWARRTGYGAWTAFQGIVLLVWLTVECLMLRIVVWPHYLYGAVGLALLIAGIVLTTETKPARRSIET